MDNFEYSIQLNDREWAEFLRAAEECSLAPASLATAEDEHIEPGDAAGPDCPRGGDNASAAGPGTEPAPAVPRGDVAGVTAVSSEPLLLCDRDKDSRLSAPAMPSAQRRQPPRPPPAATTAGDTAQGTATAGDRDTEPSRAPGQGGDAGGGQVAQPGAVAHPGAVTDPGVVTQPGVVAQPGLVAHPGVVMAHPEAPAAPSSAEGPAQKSSVPPEPYGDPSPAQVTQEGDSPSSPGGSPTVVRPKVPAQPRKSRRQRGASATEGDKDTPGAGKAPPGSPMSPRKGKGKDKAAKAALLRSGSEEAAENKRPMPGPAGDGPEPQKPKGKEPQSPGKAKATKAPKAGQAGGPGVRDSVPAVPAGQCQDMPGEPLQPRRDAAFAGNSAQGAGGEPAAESPGVPAAEIPRKASDIPGTPAAEIPGIPVVEIPGIPAAEIPTIPAAEIPRKASEIPAVPAAKICRKPSEIHGTPAVETPGTPAAGIPGIPAAVIPRKPAAGISWEPAAGIPRIPPVEIPRIPPAGIPRSPAIEIPRIPAAEIPRIPAIEIPTIPALGIPTIGIPTTPDPPRAISPLCFPDGSSARPNSLDVTWPEMYEYLFCDSQEEEDELGSSPEGRKSPLQREISWPELYEYFFNEPEGSRKKGKAKERRRRKKLSGLGRAGLQEEGPSSVSGEDTVVIPVPEVYEHFHTQRPQNTMGWRGIFSVPSASEVKRAVRALRALLQRQDRLGGGQGQAPLSPSQALVARRSGQELALVPLGGAQGWPQDEDMALALTGAAEDPRVLSHKDMCLVFCAFASWAVKTSDLQAPDAWKTMFLASFGTLSAIRYFRRQVREGHPRT